MLRIAVWLAAAGWLILPFLGHSQIVPEPTSTIPLPTSSVPQPLELQQRMEYAYPAAGLDPVLARILSLAAVLLAVAGIMLLAGTAERTWSTGIRTLSPRHK